MAGVLAVQLLLVAILIVGGFSLLYPSPGIAVLLAGLSAAWLPANNGHLEGPVLIVVANDHGLTTADLLTYLGLALSLLAGWRWRRNRLDKHGADGPGVRWPAMAAFVAIVVLLLGCGLAASWLNHDRRHRGSFGLTPVSAHEREHDDRSVHTGRPRMTPTIDAGAEMVVTLAQMSERATKRGRTAGVPAAGRASRPASEHFLEEATQ